MDKNIKAGEEILRVEGLKKYFPVRGKSDAFVKAIDGIDFDLARGETLGLVGESGSGKSTTAYNVVGMETMTDGKITFLGHDIKRNTDSVSGSWNFSQSSENHIRHIEAAP